MLKHLQGLYFFKFNYKILVKGCKRLQQNNVARTSRFSSFIIPREYLHYSENIYHQEGVSGSPQPETLSTVAK